MITNSKYFENVTDKINVQLTASDSQVTLIWRTGIYDFSPENIKTIFSEIFIQFPYEIEESSNTLGMSVYIQEVFHLFYCLEPSKKISRDERANTKKKFENQKNATFHWFTILDFLEEYFHRIVYDYAAFINNTKKLYFLDGIEDESIVLKNLLKLYQEVLHTKDAQLVIFSGLRLTKRISDIVTKALIGFIENRLSMLCPDYSSTSTQEPSNIIKSKNPPILWLGTQQDLCELFYELQRNGYIPEIEQGDRRRIGKSILELFNIEATKRNPKSDSTNAFIQILKGDFDKESKERRYPWLEKPNYVRKFKEVVSIKKE